MKLCDLPAKSLQILLILLVTCDIECLTLLLYLALNAVHLLWDNRLDNEENLAETNSVFQLGDQVFILIRHIFNLLTKFLLDTNEISQLGLQSIHLHVLNLFVFFIKLALHLTYLFKSLLFILCLEISVHVFTINIAHNGMSLFLQRNLFIIVDWCISCCSWFYSVLLEQWVRDNHMIAHYYVLI